VLPVRQEVLIRRVLPVLRVRPPPAALAAPLARKAEDRTETAVRCNRALVGVVLIVQHK
jgi:hypothetical protein